MSNELALYRNLLTEIKGRVRQAQHKAALSANAHMTLMYWDIGRMIGRSSGTGGLWHNHETNLGTYERKGETPKLPAQQGQLATKMSIG